jgi:hypothetical protein
MTVSPSIPLFLNGRPATIAGLVVPVIIETIKRSVGWTLSHIGEEVFKLLPSWANFNPAPSIVLIARVIGIGAPCMHRGPTRIGPAAGHTMRDLPGSRMRHKLRASAALGEFTFEVAGHDNPSFSAIAPTTPISAGRSWPIRCSFYNHQLSEPMANQINQM